MSESVQERNDDEIEVECRVCRDGPENDRELFSPCLCSGSIMYCHQSCLEEWLQHSRKDHCELCNTKYVFIPLYADNTPTIIPIHRLFYSTIKKILLEFLPFGLRITVAAFLWLLVVPIVTSGLYSFWIRHNYTFAVMELLEWSSAWSYIISGFVLAGVIAMSFIIMLSFADFLRFHWNIERRQVEGGVEGENPRRRQRNIPNVMGLNPAAALPPHQAPPRHHQPIPVVPLPPVQAPPIQNNEMGPVNINNNDPDANNQNEQNDANENDINNQEDIMEIINNIFDNDDNENNQVDAPPPIPRARAARPPHAEALRAQVLPNQVPRPGQGQDLEEEFDDVLAADVEIHVAVDELLGLRGPPLVLWRNIIWLLIFNGTYMGLFAFVPYGIGITVYKAILRFMSTIDGIPTVDPWIPTQVITFCTMLNVASVNSSSSLQIQDMFFILIGYATISAIVFILGAMVSGIHSRLDFASVTVFKDVFEGLVAVVKVGVLLSLRIFLLPIVLGGFILLNLNNLLEYPLETWVNLTVTNVIGLLSVLWVLGISFMLVVTISVLQLREVLHPDVLGHLIRPQEAHLDLLSSLMNESGLTHTRRIVISMAVYFFLMFLFVSIPILILRQLIGSSIPIYILTFIPELVIPVEMALLHLSFLSILDKYKDLIGKIEFHWLRFACTQLGLERFLLPYAKKVTRPIMATGIDWLDRRTEILPNTSSSSSSSGSNEHVTLQAVEEEVEDVPMQRPLTGWALHQSDNTNRWSFGSETPSELERTVASRVIPKYWAARCLVLLFLSWILVMVLVTVVVAIPCLLGRLVFMLLRVPPWLFHEPCSVGVGTYLCIKLYNVMTSRDGEYASTILRSILTAPVQVRNLVAKVFAVGVLVAPAALGFLTRVAITCRWTSTLSSLFSPNLSHLFHDWILGICLGGLWMAKFRRLPPVVLAVIGFLRGKDGVTIGNAIVRTLHFIESRRWNPATAALSRLYLMVMNYYQPMLLLQVTLSWCYLKGFLEWWLVIKKADAASGGAVDGGLWTWLLPSLDEWLVNDPTPPLTYNMNDCGIYFYTLIFDMTFSVP